MGWVYNTLRRLYGYDLFYVKKRKRRINIIQIAERHTKMLTVDQAAASYRALLALGKKQGAPQAHRCPNRC